MAFPTSHTPASQVYLPKGMASIPAMIFSAMMTQGNNIVEK